MIFSTQFCGRAGGVGLVGRLDLAGEQAGAVAQQAAAGDDAAEEHGQLGGDLREVDVLAGLEAVDTVRSVVNGRPL
jgi:hypothetical protein